MIRRTLYAFLLLAGGALTTAATEPGVWYHARAIQIRGLPPGPFVRLRDGKILAVDAPRDVLISADGGKTWQRSPMFPAEAEFIFRPERALLCTRSLDGGRIWEPPQKLHEEWTGALRDIIQTRDGTVVFTSMRMLHDPGRHSVLTPSSIDDGRSWRRSNVIDLGGAGHHSGVVEATPEELRDGRLWMLIRTNWKVSWEAFSEMPASVQRKEMSLMISTDDGKTWTKPVLIVKRGGFAYPYLFEVRPGELWVTTMYGNLRVTLLEQDFLGGQ